MGNDRYLKNMRLFASSLETEYVLSKMKATESSKYGLFKDSVPFTNNSSAFPIHIKSVRKADADRLGGETVPSAGAHFSHSMALVTSYGEAIERYCVPMPLAPDLYSRSRRDLVEQGEAVVEAAALMPFADFQFELPNFPFTRFSEDRACHWKYVDELTGGQKELVPTAALHWTGKRLPELDRFVEVNSNGFACAADPQSAIRSGLLEVLERDAFSFLWWTKQGAPAVKFPLPGDSEQVMRVNEIVRRSQGKIKVVKVRTDIEIDTYLTLFFGDVSAGEPAFLVTGACREIGIDGIEKSLVEFCHSYNYFVDFDFQKSLEISRNFDESILGFDDGASLYLEPTMAEHCKFLWNGEWAQLSPSDLIQSQLKGAAGLEGLLQDLKGLGHKVYAVDYTTRDIRKAGFEVFKVWIPSFIQANGRHFSRNWGSQRLLGLSKKLGLIDRFLSFEDLNPLPHPFP